MPYGKKARCVRAYTYGCLNPTSGEGKAIDAMSRRVRLWNQLVELERQYEPLREDLIAPHVTVENDEDHRDEYRKQRRETFRRDDVKAALAALEKQKYEAARRLWLESELYWCNHEEVKLAWQQARRRPGELRFHSSRHGGKLTVRWQNGLTVAEAFGNSNRFRLAPVPEEAYTSAERAVRRRLCRTTVSIRVASDNQRPVWLDLPCVLHRPLPSDGLIRSASVLRERIGTHWRWRLVVIVETPDGVKVSGGTGTIALDLGWRKQPEGLRVCYWYDDSGRHGEIVLSNHWLAGMQKVENLRSIRDMKFNAAVKGLATWLDQAQEVPEWFREQTATLLHWRAAAKLAALVLRWRERRFSSDEETFELLENWRKRDKHLFEYEANLRDKLVKSRRDQYRLVAAWIARNYQAVKLGDIDLRRVARRRRKHGAVNDMVPAARHQRVLAAPSVLRLAVLNACKREGLRVEAVKAAHTTVTCWHCGSIEVFDKAKELVHTCSACGKVWDQDENATRNILSETPARA